MSRIPQTKARLQPYIKLYTIKGGGNVTEPQEIAQLVQQDEGLQVVGGVQRVQISQNRGTNIWRELNADTYGKIQEVVPELPTYNLQLDKIVLYKENILEAFGFDGSDILNQYKPFFVSISLLAPDNVDIDPLTYIYHNCWFEGFELEFNIDAGDLRMMQSQSVATAGVISSNAVPSGATE